jgi:hypothetical protein
MKREIIEVRGPKMAYFEFMAPDHQNFRIAYQTLRFTFPDPIVLVRQMESALKVLRDELEASEGDGVAIWFWRTEPRYEINPVCYTNTDDQTGLFEARCRVATYPILNDLVWCQANEFPMTGYKVER